jgi:uncharacterized membrane protein YeiH
MNNDDAKLSLLAVATAIGGGFIVKLALDEMLGTVQPAYAREFEEAHAKAFGLVKDEPGELSEALAFAVAFGMSTFALSQGLDTLFGKVSK